jgi:hypothetical protein
MQQACCRPWRQPKAVWACDAVLKSPASTAASGSGRRLPPPAASRRGMEWVQSRRHDCHPLHNTASLSNAVGSTPRGVPRPQVAQQSLYCLESLSTCDQSSVGLVQAAASALGFAPGPAAAALCRWQESLGALLFEGCPMQSTAPSHREFGHQFHWRVSQSSLTCPAEARGCAGSASKGRNRRLLCTRAGLSLSRTGSR